jgi:triphosphoribosyl-dephospho-CoA synthase
VSATGTRQSAIARAVWSACVVEVRALKPGNVSVYADGHGMSADDFIRSARGCAQVLGRPGMKVGERILESVELTIRTVGCNTNLGIILLAAPLAEAAQRPAAAPLRASLQSVLRGLDVEDAQLAYRAIRLARPGGLGRSPRHDVQEAPHVTLLEAMAEAQERDRIARQYASGYEDVFTLGVAQLEEALARWQSEEWSAVAVFLAYLSRFHDTHIERKYGAETAEEVCRKAARVAAELQRSRRPEQAILLLTAFDRELKEAGINPGTSADLTVATLLVPRLEAVVSGLGAQHSELAGLGNEP